MREEVGAWLTKAREDYRVAEIIRAANAAASLAAFHCQQAIEKGLKALVADQGQEVPRSHDLEDIASRLPRGTDVGASIDELRRATAYAVAPRYPYFPTDEAEKDLGGLLDIAKRVLDAVEAAVR